MIRRELDGDLSEEMRSLLDAGASDVVDYDYERGLAMHVAAIGVPLATLALEAAPPLLGSGASAAASGGSAGLAGAAKAGATLGPALATSKAWVGFVAVPLATAAAAVAMWLGGSPATPAEGSADGAKVESAPAFPPAAVRPDPPATGSAESPARGVTAGEAHGDVARETAAGKAGAIRPAAAADARSPAGARLAAPTPSRVRSVQSVHVAPRLSPAATGTSPVEESPSLAPEAPPAAEPAPQPAVGPSAEERLAEEQARQRRATLEQSRQSNAIREEMEALMEAKRALTRDPKRALHLSREAQLRYGDSALGEERQHILILALIALGRTSEAQRLAAPYLKAHPGSPFALRVKKALDAASSR